MRRILIALTLFPLIALANALPSGVTVTIELKNSTNNSLTMSPKESTDIVLRFLNHTNEAVRLRIHDFDPYHQKLPYPIECAIRITDNNGKFHALAKENGEWWSQFKCWSTLFDKDDERNFRILKVGEELAYRVSLAEVLKVPAGGEPKGWPYNSSSGFKVGDYRFKFRYGDIVSKMFSLKVVEKGIEAN